MLLALMCSQSHSSGTVNVVHSARAPTTTAIQPQTGLSSDLGAAAVDFTTACFCYAPPSLPMTTVKAANTNRLVRFTRLLKFSNCQTIFKMNIVSNKGERAAHTVAKAPFIFQIFDLHENETVLIFNAKISVCQHLISRAVWVSQFWGFR